MYRDHRLCDVTLPCVYIQPNRSVRPINRHSVSPKSQVTLKRNGLCNVWGRNILKRGVNKNLAEKSQTSYAIQQVTLVREYNKLLKY